MFLNTFNNNKGMAKFSSQALLPLIALIGCLPFLGFAHRDDTIIVAGKVYCDTCRASFVTEVSTPISGAKVQLTCKGREAGNLTYSIEGETSADGYYKLVASGDHEDEICEVKLVKSPVEDCSEIAPGLDRARVLITSNNGIAGESRFVNSLGFLKKQPLKECSAILKALGLLPNMIPTK